MARRANDFAIAGDSPVLTAAEPRARLLELSRGGCLSPGENRRCGMAQIHIDIWDKDLVDDPAAARANSMVLIDCVYETAGGGGQFTFDATRGRILSVGAVDSIVLTARMVPSVTGEELFPWATKRLSCTVHWPGTISPKEIGLTDPTVALVLADGVAVPSAWFPIPRQAEEVLVYSPEPAKFGTLMLELATSNGAGAAVRYATLNPNANGTKVRHGVEFYRFRQTANVTQSVFADFTLVP